MTRERMQGSQKKRRKFPLVPIGFFLAVVLFAIFFFQKQTGAKTTVVTPIRYEQKIGGKGVFVFHEFIPGFLANLELKHPQFSDGERLRVDTPVEPLDEEKLVLAEESLHAIQQELGGNVEKVRKSLLEKEAEYLKKAIDEKALFMPFSGVVRYDADGYERIFVPEGMDALMPGDVAGMSNSAQMKRKSLRFVDNRSFYFLLDLSQRIHYPEWKIGKTYTLSIDGNADFEGKLEMIRKDDLNRQLLVFAMNRGYEKASAKRFSEGKVHLSSVEAFLLPRDSVFEENGAFYCYVLDEKEMAKKIKLTVLDVTAENREWIVTNADEAGLRSYAQVFLVPADVEEGRLYR